jgi:predicted nucleotidyltransferase
MMHTTLAGASTRRSSFTSQGRGRAPCSANSRSSLPPESSVCGAWGIKRTIRAAQPPPGEISLAFVFGSIAKRVDTASSDIDVLIVSDTLSYAELFTLLETATQRLGRAVNPMLYSNDEMTARLGKKNAFITKVFAQDKLWIIGSERDIAP